MSDAVTALGGGWFEGFVTVEEMPLQGMITLRGDLSSNAVKNASTGVAGVDMPAMGEVFNVDQRGICWMSPDELLILTPYAEVDQAIETMRRTLQGEHAMVVDVSDARAVFRLHGPDVREVLAKVSPADLAPDSLAPGQMRRTRLAQVAAAFWLRDEETAHVICFRSVAQYVFDLLSNAAKPGSEVRHF